MLASVRTAAIVAALALATSLVVVQVGRQDQSVPPGAAEPGGSWVTVTGTQEIEGATGARSKAATNSMSDPRLDGDVEITWEATTEYPGVFRDPYALSGTVTITNDEGTWRGQWIGFTDEQGRLHVTEWFEGTGGYDGLRYIEQLVERDPGGLLDATGLIYEGPIPPTVVPADMADVAE
jgi:hypothetical protein